MTGGTAVNGSAIDTKGWMGVAFIIEVGAITGAGALDARIMEDTASGMGNATNVTNGALTQVAAASNNNVAIIDYRNPAKQYVRLTLTQSVNTVVAGATAVLYGRDGVLPATAVAVQTVSVQG
jgi:hypothetical protein